MHGNFITNEDKLLSDVLNGIIPTAKEVAVLVGYFYFSGLKEIAKGLKDKKVRILVGMDIDKNVSDFIKEINILDYENKLSAKEVKDNYLNSLVNLFNESDYFDIKERQETFKIFIEKIYNKTLEIRKTKEPHHAKLYLFEKSDEFTEGGFYQGQLVTGSSNLTYSGLKGRNELNVIIRDNHYYFEAKEIFENLWKKSVVIVDEKEENIKYFDDKFIKKIWLDKLPKPFLVYLKVLKEYFSIKKSEIKTASEITKNKYINLKYQFDAIQQGLDILKKHNGVIIADVVGLGKSIIASVIANNLNLKTIIIAPPHLNKQWDDYRSEFWFNGKVFSSGKIKDIIDDGFFNSDDEKLIIIDEAHKYRNSESLNYLLLHKVCLGNKVVLMSATPFNNNPSDLFSLIKLFQIPKRPTIYTEIDLSYDFRILLDKYKKAKNPKNKKNSNVINKEIEGIATKLRDILAPITIRRSRIDLLNIKDYKEDLEIQKIEFPVVSSPELINYELSKIEDLYIKTFNKISSDDTNSFKAIRYKSLLFVKDEFINEILNEFEISFDFLEKFQNNIGLFMKRLLIRRFESSIFAFKKSIDKMIDSYEKIRKLYNEKGCIPIARKSVLPDYEDLIDYLEYQEDSKDVDDVEKIEEGIIDDYDSYTKKIFFIKKEFLKETFIKELEKDISVLNEIKNSWKYITFDPKLNCFINHLNEVKSNKENGKIIIFSEFADTVNYLYEELSNKKYKVMKYTAKDKHSLRDEIVKNFDASTTNQEDNYDILIATDAISEGFNLHRANIIYNYDIPYNPTKVIQRVGRINRINKKMFDTLYIYNFFPTAQSDVDINIKTISTFKLKFIQYILGDDTQILTKDENLKSFFDKYYDIKQEEISWDTEYRKFLSENKEYFEITDKIPKKVRIGRKKECNNSIISFIKKGDDFVFKTVLKEDKKKDIVSISHLEAFKLFEALKDEKSLSVSDNFDDIYLKLKEYIFKREKTNYVDKRTPVECDVENSFEVIKEKLTENSENHDYIESIQKVMDFDSLPKHFYKIITKIKEKYNINNISDCNNFIDELKTVIEYKYLQNIIKRINSIDSTKESIIISEEFI